MHGWFHSHRTHIDRRLRVEVGRGAIARYVVSQKDLPAFRFVDLYRAIDTHLASVDDVRSVESDNSESLHKLLHGRGQSLGFAPNHQVSAHGMDRRPRRRELPPDRSLLDLSRRRGGRTGHHPSALRPGARNGSARVGRERLGSGRRAAQAG